MLTANPAAIPAGEACAFQLPRDPSAASRARSLTAATMRQLGYATDPIEDAKLAVSELATNGFTHASSTAALPELWIWARTCPTPQLVVSVFDAHRDTWPILRGADPLDEHGRGLSIVVALSADTGSHFTRSRLTAATGKCVWFALPLPTPWPAIDRVVAPLSAASRLSAALRARGVPTTCRSDDSGISILNTGALNVWVEPKVFSWRDGQGYVRQPLLDLQEAAERIIRHHETPHTTSPP
ncbi:ATP-binding protein [Actinomadura welshii]|uniref:ATP-binding protein n=1 Tax=Actinomadura welshii TaxID=3103817 RepID=UPI0003AD70A7|nr:ATP-binding protein [Actinomadura madurae]